MIEIVPYKNSWPEEFEALSTEIRQALNKTSLRIDHIGSTSVPGLVAKDILDVMIGVADFDEVPKWVEALSGLGFDYVARILHDHLPAGFTDGGGQWEKRLFSRRAGGRKVNLHVRLNGSDNQRFALLFRDYLRVHPTVAAGYGAVKMELAAFHGQDETGEAYTIIKDPVCDIIVAAAEDWAEVEGWSVR